MSSLAIRPARAPSPVAIEVESLVAAYPNLSNEELERLITLYPRLPILDAALMSGDDELAAKLDAFHETHGARMRTPLPHLAFIFAVPVFYLLVVAWMLLRG